MTVRRQRHPGDDARYFGPYLGGQKARDAVSGLANLALWTALGGAFVAWRFRWQT